MTPIPPYEEIQMKMPFLPALPLLSAVLVLVIGSAVPAATAAAQEGHESHDHEEAVHFTHPLFAESVSPDTKVRLDYASQRLSAEGRAIWSSRANTLLPASSVSKRACTSIPTLEVSGRRT